MFCGNITHLLADVGWHLGLCMRCCIYVNICIIVMPMLELASLKVGGIYQVILLISTLMKVRLICIGFDYLFQDISACSGKNWSWVSHTDDMKHQLIQSVIFVEGFFSYC